MHEHELFKPQTEAASDSRKAEVVASKPLPGGLGEQEVGLGVNSLPINAACHRWWEMSLRSRQDSNAGLRRPKLKSKNCMPTTKALIASAPCSKADVGTPSW